MDAERAAHQARLARVVASLRGDGAGHAAPLGLSKRTSNLFRDRAAGPKRRLDLGEFTHVLGIDLAAGWVDVEGSIRYESLVDATLPHGVMPAVVPQLKTITVGGAAAGVGIEATSFRQGLVHDTLLDFEVLLPDGSVVACAPGNAHGDLFFGFPNSYGTLGYAVRLRLKTIPVRPWPSSAPSRSRTPRCTTPTGLRLPRSSGTAATPTRTASSTTWPGNAKATRTSSMAWSSPARTWC